MGDVAREQGAAVADLAATPDQIMIAAVMTLAERLGPGAGVDPDGLENLTGAVTEAITSAMDAEREACAQAADEMRRGGNPEGAADAIRARGAK